MSTSAGGYLRHIHACNQPVREPFLRWIVEDQTVGWVRPVFAHYLLAFDHLFEMRDACLYLTDDLRGFAAISDALSAVATALAADGRVPPVMNEPYPVTSGGRETALAVVDRVLAAYLGLRSFGQHLNGFVQDGDKMLMWIARRARDRLIYPGALDNMVAGGLPYGIELAENLYKECQEEAGMPVELAALAKPVGALSYNRVAERGFRPDVLYCYDLALPADFEPQNTDGEVEEFMLLPIEEVAQIVREQDRFKLNCNLVVIDFLIRHAVIGPEHPEYLALNNGLHQPLGMHHSVASADEMKQVESV